MREKVLWKGESEKLGQMTNSSRPKDTSSHVYNIFWDDWGLGGGTQNFQPL